MPFEAVEGAYLETPHPKHKVSLEKFEVDVLGRLSKEFPEAVAAQEARLAGLTLMQVCVGGVSGVCGRSMEDRVEGGQRGQIFFRRAEGDAVSQPSTLISVKWLGCL